MATHDGDPRPAPRHDDRKKTRGESVVKHLYRYILKYSPIYAPIFSTIFTIRPLKGAGGPVQYTANLLYYFYIYWGLFYNRFTPRIFQKGKYLILNRKLKYKIQRKRSANLCRNIARHFSRCVSIC